MGLSDETKKAAQEEIQRRKRVQEKQRLFEEKFSQRGYVAGRPATNLSKSSTDPEVDENGMPRKEAPLVELPLDFEDVTKEACVEVSRHLVKNLKPHQGRGIKFLWDAVFESKD